MKPTRPGSQAARVLGCTCAIVDNHYGHGRYGDYKKYFFFVSGGCPEHWPSGKVGTHTQNVYGQY